MTSREKEDAYRQTREYVAKGVISPSIIVEKTSISSWQTAKRYIERAKRELIDDQVDLRWEYKRLLCGIKRIEQRCFEIEETTDNDLVRLGALNSALKAQDKLIKLFSLDQLNMGIIAGQEMSDEAFHQKFMELIIQQSEERNLEIPEEIKKKPTKKPLTDEEINNLHNAIHTHNRKVD